MSKDIKGYLELKDIVRDLRKRGKTIVFTNGCFDLIHPGHIKCLSQAKKKGDVLIVGLNSDSSVRRIKGRPRPLINQKGRKTILSGLEAVDYVIVFNEATPLKLIKIIRPDILIKGADWHDKGIVGSNFVRSYGGRVFTIKLIKGYSTTNLIKKIAQRFK